MRVLIADADDDLLVWYRKVLLIEGFDVATTQAATDCLGALRDFRPDVLVLDPELPTEGGEMVLAAMHQDADIPLVPVIVLSAGRDLECLYRVASYPVSEWLDKPVGPQLLVRHLRRILSLEAEPAPAATR